MTENKYETSHPVQGADAGQQIGGESNPRQSERLGMLPPGSASGERNYSTASHWKDAQLSDQIKANLDLAASMPLEAALWRRLARPYVVELRRRERQYPGGTAAWHLSMLSRRLGA